MTTNALSGQKRLIIKIGSALLVDARSGAIRTDWLASLADDIAALKSEGCEIVIVSSGAVAFGRKILKLGNKVLPLDQSQAAASVGQIALSQAWRDVLGARNIIAGQILITPNITEERRYYLNARTTMHTALGLGVVPIINENDSVATTEIRYGENDRLSARVASMIDADLLILLSDVDGLYSAPPDANGNGSGTHIPEVTAITAEIEAMAGGAASLLSRGGMQTKLEAAKIATKSGAAMIIAKGTDLHPLKALREGARHTLFTASQSPHAARKRWIQATLSVAGQLRIDAGAVRALKQGRSLLPIGVTRVSGEFTRGEALAILDPEGLEIARGLAGLSSEEAKLVRGKHSATIVELLGPDHRTELVHRDNLVLLTPETGDEK